MARGAEVFDFLEAQLRASFAACGIFEELVARSVTELPDHEFELRRDRHSTFERYFAATKGVFQRCVSGGYSEGLRRMILRDSESFVPAGFYERLPGEAWTTPLFYRTDESKSGHVFELQCPGSGWGDLPLLSCLYRNFSPHKYLESFAPETTIASDIAAVCGVTNPFVLHLLDNASNAPSMRFLMSRTQPPLHYCGFSREAVNAKVHFVRSHSVFGLINENLFRVRLERCARGELWFDCPPLVIFDQKMMLCLPFLEETRAEFDDSIRDILVYSYPVADTGFRDIDGRWVTLEAFMARKPSERRYFLKYAGSDTNRNWGSRGVYRLNNNKAGSLLKMAVADAEIGLPWLIQPEVAEKETIEFYSRATEDITSSKLTAKYSTFYGPSGFVGLRTMHRNHHNVHGQSDTVIGLAVPVYRP